MNEITKDAVYELRLLTGDGLMDCKGALIEANGDIVKAKQLLDESRPNKGKRINIKSDD